MQKLTFLSSLLICLLLALPAGAQPDSLWTTTVVGNGNTILNCAVSLNSTGFIVGGYSAGSATNADFFVARISMNGDVVWAHNYLETTSLEEVNGLVVVNDTIIAVGYGQSENTDPGIASVYLFALNLDGALLWNRTYDPQGMSKARDAELLNDGNIGIIGYRLGINNRSDAWFLKCTPAGDTLWTRTYGNTSTDIGQRLKQLPDGNILLFCNMKTGNTDRYDFWPITIDPVGNVVSDTTFGTDSEEVGYGISIENDGSITLVGKQVTLPGTSGFAACLPAAEEPWAQAYNQDGLFEELHGVLVRQTGLLCVGKVGATTSQTHPFMLGISPQGNRIWGWAIGAAGGGNLFNGIIQVPSDGGGFVFGAYTVDDTLRGYVMRIAPPTGVVGRVLDSSTGDPLEGVRIGTVGDNRFVRTNQNGEYAFELSVGTYDLTASGRCVESDTVFSVVVPEESQASVDITLGVPHLTPGQSSVNMIAFNHVQSNGVYLLENIGTGLLEYQLGRLCIDPPGDWMSLSSYSGTIPAGQTANVTVTVTADTTDSGTFSYYGMLIVTSNSCPDTLKTIPVLVSVMDTDEQPNAVNEFGLSAIYPNPFNNEASIRFSLEQPGATTLKIFDVTGRAVAVLADEQFMAGQHTIAFSLPNAASGIYLAQLQSNNQTDVKKFALIK